MDTENEYNHNRMLMKRVKKEDNAITIVYAINIAISLFLLVSFILTFEKVYLVAVLLGTAASVTGFFSVYRKDITLAIVSGFLLIGNIAALFFSDGSVVLGIIELFVFGWFAYRNLMNVKRYKWLEQQDGFPNFDINQAMYDREKAQWSIKDPYTQKMEERRKSSKDSMDTL